MAITVLASEHLPVTWGAWWRVGHSATLKVFKLRRWGAKTNCRLTVSRHSDTWCHSDTAPQCVTSLLWKCTAYVAWHRDVPSSKDTGHPSGQVAKVGNQAAPAAWWFTGLGVFAPGIEICRQIPIFGINWSIWASKKSPPYVLHPQWIKVRNRWLSSEKWCLRTAWMTPKFPAPDRSLISAVTRV